MLRLIILHKNIITPLIDVSETRTTIVKDEPRISPAETKPARQTEKYSYNEILRKEA
jgi:hypothetical protein